MLPAYVNTGDLIVVTSHFSSVSFPKWGLYSLPYGVLKGRCEKRGIKSMFASLMFFLFASFFFF